MCAVAISANLTTESLEITNLDCGGARVTSRDVAIDAERCAFDRTPFHKQKQHSQTYAKMTLAGLEPAIFGSEDQRLIH